MAEEIKAVELNEVENNTTNTENVELNEQATAEQPATEQKEEIKPLPEQKPFILNRYEQVILNEMERRAKEIPALAEGLKDKGKSIQECYAFVTHRAKKMAEGNSAMIEDAVVYEWAIFYYTQSRQILDLEFEAMRKPSAPTYTPSKPATKAKNEKKDTKKAESKADAPKAENKAEKPAKSEEDDEPLLLNFDE